MFRAIREIFTGPSDPAPCTYAPKPGSLPADRWEESDRLCARAASETGPHVYPRPEQPIPADVPSSPAALHQVQQGWRLCNHVHTRILKLYTTAQAHRDLVPSTHRSALQGLTDRSYFIFARNTRMLSNFQAALESPTRSYVHAPELHSQRLGESVAWFNARRPELNAMEALLCSILCECGLQRDSMPPQAQRLAERARGVWDAALRVRILACREDGKLLDAVMTAQAAMVFAVKASIAGTEAADPDIARWDKVLESWEAWVAPLEKEALSFVEAPPEAFDWCPTSDGGDIGDFS